MRAPARDLARRCHLLHQAHALQRPGEQEDAGHAGDERRGQELAQLVPFIPQNRILIETDSPYLLPRSMRPKPKSSKNKPEYLPYIANYIANLRGEDADEFAKRCYQNSLAFFNLDRIHA